jgi:hypothetical protein
VCRLGCCTHRLVQALGWLPTAARAEAALVAGLMVLASRRRGPAPSGWPGLRVSCPDRTDAGLGTYAVDGRRDRPAAVEGARQAAGPVENGTSDH